MVRFRDEHYKKSRNKFGIEKTIKTSLNAFHTVGTDDYSLILFTSLPDLYVDTTVDSRYSSHPLGSTNWLDFRDSSIIQPQRKMAELAGIRELAWCDN